MFIVLGASIVNVTMMDQVLQYGALGIVLVMVIMNWIDRQRTNKVLERKDAQIQGQLDRMQSVTSNTIRTMDRFCNLLERRPCLRGQVRVPDESET